MEERVQERVPIHLRVLPTKPLLHKPRLIANLLHSCTKVSSSRQNDLSFPSRLITKSREIADVQSKFRRILMKAMIQHKLMSSCRRPSPHPETRIANKQRHLSNSVLLMQETAKSQLPIATATLSTWRNQTSTKDDKWKSMAGHRTLQPQSVKQPQLLLQQSRSPSLTLLIASTQLQSSTMIHLR